VPNKGFQNSGVVNNQGIELAVNAEATKNLTLNATYSYIHMENPVYATPGHHLYFNAGYRLKKLLLNANIQQINNLDNDPSPKVNLESYTLLNAKISYNLFTNLSLYVSAENLLNQDYEVNRYYTMPGTTVFGGVNFNF
jgi:iron complex outermembrane receptor protein